MIKVPKNICGCECHVHGESIIHFMSCCEYCYEKYIDEDGSFNEVAFDLMVAKKIKEENIPKRKRRWKKKK